MYITFLRRFSINDEVIVINSMFRFSFNKQFPKCNAWLTYSSSISYYMTLEFGILKAMKGKFNPRKGENVLYQTLKHDSLHAVFADMESQLVLPKSWKLKL
jgi:hypothetical protein